MSDDDTTTFEVTPTDGVHSVTLTGTDLHVQVSAGEFDLFVQWYPDKEE